MPESKGTAEDEKDMLRDTLEKRINPLSKTARSLANIDLLVDAKNDFDQVDWFSISKITFYLGMIGLSIWSLTVSMTVVLDYSLSSPTLLGSAQRVFTVFPFLPVFFSCLLFFRDGHSNACREVGPLTG